MFEYASFATRNPSYVTQNARRQWAVRKALLEYRKANPVCEATGKTSNLHIHHIEPVSLRPDLAGVPENMMTLEAKAHLYLGHFGNYKTVVTNVREVIDTIKVQRTFAHG